MNKFFSVTLSLLLISGTALAQLNEPYVRKRIRPNFFIPEGALSEERPEKVGMPQYRQGISTAKHISSQPERPSRLNTTPENITVENTVNDNQTVQVKAKEPELQTATTATYGQTEEKQTSSVPSNLESTPVQTNEPSYQKMYQDYLKDLDSIAQKGSISNSSIQQDLSKMNSEQRIKIDKKFNSQRNVQKDIMDALK